MEFALHAKTLCLVEHHDYGRRQNGHYTEARAYDTQTYADLMVNINKTFGEDWSLNANIGASINNIKTDELSYRGPIQRTDFPTYSMFSIWMTRKNVPKRSAGTTRRSRFSPGRSRLKQMLYLTVTGRNDWASQLANSPESSFFYPSVSRPVLGAFFDMGSGQDVQLSEDPRFDRLGRYAFPASPDGSDLRIRRYE